MPKINVIRTGIGSIEPQNVKTVKKLHMREKKTTGKKRGDIKLH